MSFDLIHSHFSQILEKQVASGELIPVEGLVVASVLEGGIEKLKLPSAATDIILGFAITDSHNYAIQPVVESLVVPSAAPFRITLAHSPIAASERIVSPVIGALVLGNPANAGEYNFFAPNVIEVNAARAGETLAISYSYALTVLEAEQKFYQRNINRKASQYYNQIAFGCGYGEIFLDCYDTSKDYSNFAPGTGLIVLFAGADKGYVSVGTLAGNLAFPGHVIKLPAVDDARLGLSYQIIKK